MTLYTIGYEGRSLPQFLGALGTHAVRLLADVREAPISRKPGFSKSALQRVLAGADIAYVHLRALGCPKAIRDAYRESGDWQRYTAQFMQHLRGQTEAIEQLRALSQARATALLCYEADFNRCHRSYVARAVAGPLGARVCHITPNGQRGSDTEHI
jgi:uncharacterized protein (DUF488 family)